MTLGEFPYRFAIIIEGMSDLQEVRTTFWSIADETGIAAKALHVGGHLHTFLAIIKESDWVGVPTEPTKDTHHIARIGTDFLNHDFLHELIALTRHEPFGIFTLYDGVEVIGTYTHDAEFLLFIHRFSIVNHA